MAKSYSVKSKSVAKKKHPRHSKATGMKRGGKVRSLRGC